MIGNHLWQSTLVAAMMAAATLAFRKNRASVRHALWLAASIKFLVPFAALTAFGQLLAVHAPAPVVRREVTIVFETVIHPFTGFDLPPAAHPFISAWDRLAQALPFLAIGIWIAGALAVLAAWWIRWRRIASITRRAVPIAHGPALDTLRRIERQAGLKPIPLVSSDASLEPGVFGMVHPVLLWPRTIADHLDEDQIVTVLTHEVAHVRRRDNLAAAIHMIVEALFWFHPLVWWIGARLTDEREQACDEDVLRFGSEPVVYAETILKSCRIYVESPLPCVAGVTGSDLRKRIERIMRHGAADRLTPSKRIFLAALAIGPVATPILAGAVSAPRLSSDSVLRKLVSYRVRTAGQAPAQFEVASVKPNASTVGKMSIQMQPGGRFVATNVTLKQLIRNAYDVQEFQIAGGPPWMAGDRFDVVAKSESAGRDDPFQLEKGGRWQAMLRALLVERFKLEVHTEAKELPIYALVLAHSDGTLGPQLTRSTRDCATPGSGGSGKPPSPADPPPCGMRFMPGTIQAGGTTVALFANVLSGQSGRVVLDRTGLSGDFDFTLRWTPDQIPQGFDRKASAMGLAPIDADGPSLFTAIREQLGLKLDSQKGPVDILVVDRAERPTEN
jgi:uncharacterized protein (TIGR03435 family)